MSLVEFRSLEYQQSKQVVAGEDIKREILKNGIRKLERETGLSHHTIDKILKGERVRRKTLAKIVNNSSAVERPTKPKPSIQAVEATAH